jgi:glycine/D-amino acid oxidase-like deaminating enzyme
VDTRRHSGHDAIVVGAGLVGAAIAFGLAREGRRVALLDEGDVALRASRGNFGQVWVQDKGVGVPGYQRWTRESALAWKDLDRELAERTGLGCSLVQPGGLSFCFDETAFEARTRLMQRMQREAGDFGFEFCMLRRHELATSGLPLPPLGPKVTGASYTPYDGHVNPLRLLRALHQASIEAGVDYLPATSVQSVDAAPGAFTVHAGSQRIEAGTLVLAAGFDNLRLAPMVGLACPVAPNRGQILVTEKVQPVLGLPTSDLRQTDEGGLLIGTSQESAGFDDQVTARNCATIARRAIDTFPFIAGLRIVRSWAALRVMTPDGLPVYEQSAMCPGAFVASCHSGVTLAPAHVMTLAPAIARGRLPAMMDRYSSARFTTPGADASAPAGDRHVPQTA